MKTHIVVHHTATNQGTIASQEKAINTGHKARNFPVSKSGWYIGYHYLIDLDGTVKQYRGDEETGAHCREGLMNYKGIGVSLIGNFETATITPKQLDALIVLLKSLISKHKISKENMTYHRMWKPTACPGKNILAIWGKILEELYPSTPTWEDNILKLAKDTGVLNDPDDGAFTRKQYAKMLEIIRKAKHKNDFK